MKAVVLACCAALALGSVAAGTASASSPHAQLRDFVCSHAHDPRNRSISVTAVMKPRSGTRRMELKFELLERLAGTPGEQEVTGGDLGSWIRPRNSTLGRRPGDVWVFTHPVKDLAGPANYRFRVSFRWSAAHGRSLGTAVRFSPTCHES